MRPRRLPEHVDDDGFDAFVHADHGRLLALALALTGDRTRAVEVVDAALADLLRSWVLPADTTAASVEARRQVVARSSDRPAPGAVGDPALVGRHDADRLWRAVRLLPGDQPAIMALWYVDGSPVDSIAAVVDLVPGAVETAHASALDTLDSMLGERPEIARSLLREDAPDADLSEWAP